MKKAIFLPVKSTSDRLKSKNLKIMDGKPLFLHTLEKICSMNYFDEVWLDSDSDEVFSIASHLDFMELKRDENLASNRTDGNQLLLNELKYTDAEIITQILCTAPFISKETIKNSVESIISSDDFDSSLLVVKSKQYTWSDKGPNYNIQKIPNSNNLNDTTIETMGLYTIFSEAARNTNRRIGDAPLLIEASAVEAIDVNHKDDFDLANYVAAGIREESRMQLRILKHRLSSSMLSDVIDDLGIKQNHIISGLIPNIENAKLIGRAKTLHIRELRDGEDFKGIYSALESYKSIIPGDVIIVQNDVGDLAYFGDLNANLAIRSGAEGAIIGGRTRDSQSVRQLNFFTFSKGYIGKDVRGRATTESINRTIELDGVSIPPGSLIFADNEGIIVIPKKYEDEIIRKILIKLDTEKNIINGITNNAETKELIDKYGEF